MGDVEQTKRQLIREAVRENIRPKPRRRFSPVPGQPGLSRWILAIPAVALGLFLLKPSLIVSRAGTDSGSQPESSTNGAPAAPSNVEEAGPAAALGPVAPDDLKLRQFPDVASKPLDRTLFPLSVKRVVIDAGHGGRQHGAVAESGLGEKEVTLDIAQRLKRLLEEASYEVVMTREEDETVGLDKRAEIANDKHADLFVSIHVNWMQPKKVRALETYFMGPTDDPVVTKLAAIENHDSGYSMSDYRRLLDKLYMDTRRDESRRLAESIQAELFRTVSLMNPVIQDRGVKTAPFIVLMRTDMPAVLVEVSCLSNEEEVKLLTNPEYKDSIAHALRKGIRAYASKLNGSD